MTVRIKTSGSSSTGWTQIQSFFVRTSAAWSDMANVWIKTASSAWTKVFNKPNVPEIQNKVEITISTANSTNQTKKLTGKAYHWTLATSVTYRFRKSTNDISFSNLFSPETSVNPSSGSSHTNDTYTILQSDLTPNATNYFVYVTKATNSNAGTEAESVSFSDYIDMPRDITNLTASTPTVANSIPLSWSPVAQLQAPGSYEVFYGTSTTPTTLFGITSSNSITVTGLQANTLYYFRILPWTASNARGYYGNYSNVASGQTLAAAEPQPFNTISFTKGFPSSSSQGIVRSTALSWNASTNATRYEIEYEGSNDNANWTNVQTFGASPYTTSTSQSASWGSPQPVGGYGYYYFMRARIRASNIDSATTVIGDGGAYRYATGSPPGQPSFGSISVTSTTASIPVNASSTQGSNSRYEVMEYQYRTSFTSYPGSWSAKSLSSGSGTISLSGLSASTTYYIKIRNRNFDEEYSAENETNFTTSAALTKLTTPTGVDATDFRTDGVNVTWNAVSGAAYYGVWYGSTPAPSYDSLADFGGNRNTTLITGTSYLDTSLGSGVTRDYYVQAYRSGDPTGTKSEWGGPDSGTRAAATVAPYNGSVSVNPSSGTAGSTTFTANPSGWLGTPSTFTYSYSWQYMNTSFSWVQFATGSTAVAPNVTAYAWQVVLTVSNGVSPNGIATASFSVSAPVSKLATPTGLSATTNRTDGINISWNAVSGAAYYGVWYRGGAPSYDSNPDFGGPNNPNLITGTSYLDTSIGAGVTRSYDVQAFRSGNPTGTKSDWAGPVTGTRASVTVSAPVTPTGVSLSGSGAVSWNAVSGADYYEVLNYTDRTGSPANNTNRLGPYNTTVYGTSLQLGSSQGYSSPNNWARVQVRAWNNSGQFSTYSAWVPSSTTYT